MIDQIPEADSEINFWIYPNLLRKLAYLDHFAHDASFFGPQTFPVSLVVPLPCLHQLLLAPHSL